MTDQNRNIDSRDEARTSSQDSPQNASRHEDHEGMGSTSRNRSHRSQAEMANDRGMQYERRSFSGDREHDELGSEMEDGGAIDGDIQR